MPADFYHVQMVASAVEVVEAAVHPSRGLEDTISGRGYLCDIKVGMFLNWNPCLKMNAHRVLPTRRAGKM